MSKLFEPSGIADNCWCTYFRTTARDYSSRRAAARKDMLRNLVESGEQVGVLGSVDNLSVGWIGVGPRLGFPRLRRSRVAKLLEGDDSARIWSIVCVYLAPDHRHQGLVKVLVDRATERARDEQAELVEAYPEDDRDPEAVFDPCTSRGAQSRPSRPRAAALTQVSGRWASGRRRDVRRQRGALRQKRQRSGHDSRA